MVRGVKKHFKRLNAPSHWMLDKLGGVFAPKPSPGPHKTRECLPLVLILRNRLRYALNGQEVKKVLMQRLVKVDGRVRTDPTYPAGFMDVVSIPKTDEHFRLLLDAKGRFVVHRISAEEASYKLCKVRRVDTAARGVPTLTTHDGRTLRYPDPAVRVGDTVLLQLGTSAGGQSQEVGRHVAFHVGALAALTGGHNAGRVGVITRRDVHRGGHSVVHLRDAVGHEFSTRESNVFVLGEGSTPLVSLPKAKGVRPTILEEAAARA